MWQELLAFSRLVRSSLSFFPSERRTPECNRGFCYRLFLSRCFERGVVTISYNLSSRFSFSVFLCD
jgi:hypothetical protein